MRIFVLLLLTFSFVFSFAQKKEEYFQQEVNYEIHVELDDVYHTLNGRITIDYTNNSPETLEYLFFHLWPNAYKNDETALAKQLYESGETNFYYSDENDRGYIDKIDFTTEGNKLSWVYENDIDICRVYLNQNLAPGQSIKISTPFKVKIPLGIYSRLGHIDQQYQITQWYPKPAVYDKNGWHEMPYLNQGEFYSEYGTYDVYITTPKNYVVGATGDLVNGEKELEWLNAKADSTAKIKSFPNDMSFPKSSAEKKTLHFHQEKVHDFAWFADKRYHVLKGEVELPHSKRKVTTWAMFTNNEADLWKNSIEYINDATYYYSLWNGDYPYNHVTAVDGALSAGGGMEYPNITVIGQSGTAFSLETVIMHEVGHNWFYGILGSNERDHAFMDEGINSFNEMRYIQTKYPNSNLLGTRDVSGFPFKTLNVSHYPHKAMRQYAYLFSARKCQDQPMDFPSEDYTDINYGAIVYMKSAIVFDYLKGYLGEELFDKCMQAYFEKWKFKHPQPDDLQAVFEETSGKDLKWIFKEIIPTTKTIDYSIRRAKKDTANPENYLVKIKNKGEVNGPFSISSMTKDSVINTIWYEPLTDKTTWVKFPKGDYKKLKIDGEYVIPEINQNNNTLKTKGIFKRTEPLRLQFLGSIENPDRTQLFFTPVVGYNAYDNFMAGIAFYNTVFPSKRFEYSVMPMYGFGSSDVVGLGSATYHIYPEKLFEHIDLTLDAQRFNQYNYNTPLNYNKVAPGMDFLFNKRNPRRRLDYSINYRYVFVQQETEIYDLANKKYNLGSIDYYVNDLKFNIESRDAVNPYHATLNVEQGADFVKAGIEADFLFKYKKKRTGVDVRFYIGRFLYNDNADARFNLGVAGNSDYKFDNLLLGRNETNGVLSQQMVFNEGGFKQFTNTFSYVNRWLNAINIKAALPKVPVAIYGDFAIAANEIVDSSGDLVDEVSEPIYHFGAELTVVRDVFQIYFPIYLSSDLGSLTYAEKIRFTLHLNKIKPFKMLRNFQM